MEVEITEIQRISLSPNEVLKVTLPEYTADHETAYIHGELKKIFKDNHVLVFVGDVKFEIVSVEG